jgi:LysR family transcriptional regulator of abg operon
MDTKQLEYVLAIANAGSLGRAALDIGVTQQALSKSLSRLELDYGGQLFERTSRGMVLTRLGKIVCEYAKDVVASYGRLKTAVDAELDLGRGRLIVGLSPIAATSQAGRLLTEFATSNPNIRIDVEAGIADEFDKALSLGQIDLAITTNANEAIQDHLMTKVGEEVWGVVGRRDHPMLSEAGTLSDLKSTKWIMGRNTEALMDAIDRSFIDAYLSPPRPGVMTTSVLYVLSALPVSDHLALLPRSLCEDNSELMWRDLGQGQWMTSVFIVRRRQGYSGALANDLIERLVRGDGT